MRPITDLEAEREALAGSPTRSCPVASAEVRPMTLREVAATQVMAMTITEGEWLVKVRTGGPGDPDEPTMAWTGVVPLRTVAEAPRPDERSTLADVPPSVLERERRGGSAV